jgi:hypothetical protein
MKKNRLKKLRLSKVEIAHISTVLSRKIKGGTDTISDRAFPPMSQAPDEQTICYQVE